MKKINWDFVLAVVFLVGCTVVGVAMVCNGFNEMQVGDYPKWLSTGMKVVGFAATIFFPALLNQIVAEWREEKVRKEMAEDGEGWR